MKIPDLDQVLAIEAYSFPTPWSRGIYERDITENSNSRFYCARKEEKEVIGYIGNWFYLDECHVGTIAVRMDVRREKIAHRLIFHTAIQAVEENIAYIVLEVRVSNVGANTLYQKLGFRKVGIRKGYYSDTGEDANLMILDQLPNFLERFDQEFNLNV